MKGCLALLFIQQNLKNKGTVTMSLCCNIPEEMSCSDNFEGGLKIVKNALLTSVDSIMKINLCAINWYAVQILNWDLNKIFK